MSDKLDGYPQDTENPEEWRGFLARYFEDRPQLALFARYIVEAIKEARRGSEKSGAP